MKYLIIPDIHTRWETAEKIIKHHKNDVDKVIFLGDYFDDFGDDIESIRETAEWFHHSVNQPNRIHICGNHDVHYWFKNCSEIRCAGYEQFKSIIINDNVTNKDWEKLVFFHVIDNTWLLSHAGVHPTWIFGPGRDEETKITLEELTNKLAIESRICVKNLYRREHHWFIQTGFARGGSPYYGGILWCDWNKEFHPIIGINQLVGHTPNYNLTWIHRKVGETRSSIASMEWVPQLSNDTSWNLCLDSQPGNQYYAIYESGSLTIKATKDIL